MLGRIVDCRSIFIFTGRIVLWIADPYFFDPYFNFSYRENSCYFQLQKLNEKIIQDSVFENQLLSSFKFSFVREFRMDQLNFYRLQLSSAEFSKMFPNHLKFSGNNNENQKCLESRFQKKTFKLNK